MAKFFETVTEDLRAFIERQTMFFVATAAADGRINLSPKGADSFRILSPSQCGYIDYTGSGNETAAHLLRDGRITFMFCSFSAKPLIVRLYGRGRAVRPQAPDYPALAAQFPPLAGARQIIVCDVESTQSSCGWGVPEMNFVAHRTQLDDWATRKGPDGIADYQHKNNRRSIDGFPTGLDPLIRIPIE